jgi:hypothetical protein
MPIFAETLSIHIPFLLTKKFEIEFSFSLDCQTMIQNTMIRPTTRTTTTTTNFVLQGNFLVKFTSLFSARKELKTK